MPFVGQPYHNNNSSSSPSSLFLPLTNKANANYNIEKVFAATLVTIWFINSATKLSLNSGEVWESKKERVPLGFSVSVSFIKDEYV